MSITIGNAKLNPQRVMDIRRLRGEGWSYPKLARAFDMSENQISRICRGLAWRQVTHGAEVLTDSEGQLRQLTMPQPSQEEINASLARLHKLMGQRGEGQGGESAPSAMPMPPIPESAAERAKGYLAPNRDALRVELSDEQRLRLEEYNRDRERRLAVANAQRDGEVSKSETNAEQLLEALKDADNNSNRPG